jgi:uncharacterized protein YcbX
MVEVGFVQSLWRYPVRSMRGEELESAEVALRGVLGDRCYCVVDVAERRAAEASYVPLRWSGLLGGEAALAEPPRAGAVPPPVRIRFGDGSQRASDDPDVDAWLSEQLGQSAALWRDADADGAALAGGEAEASGRAVEVEEAAEPPGAPARSYDRSPILLLTTAALKRAGSLHPEGHFAPARFRPNIVLDTGTARGFVERDWIGRTLALGSGLRLELSELCERCVMTTLPQAELAREPRILSTLAAHNSGQLGVYARVVRPGTLRRGDRAELL